MQLELYADPTTVRIPIYRRDGTIVAFTVVDAEDAHLGEDRWHFSNRGYAKRTVRTEEHPAPRTEMLHRRVVGLEFGDKRRVDHVDHDILNNTRANLRVCTDAENAQNRQPWGHRNSSSRFRGVSWRKATQRWSAYAQLAGEQYRLGEYADEREAARVAADFRRRHMPFATN